MLSRVCFTIISCVLICALSSNSPKTDNEEKQTCSTADDASLLQEHQGILKRNWLEESEQEAKGDDRDKDGASASHRTPDMIEDADSETSFIKALLHIPCKSSESCLQQASWVCGASKLVRLATRDFDVADVNKDNVISRDELTKEISSFPVTVTTKDQFTTYVIAEVLKDIPSSFEKLTAQAFTDGSIHKACKDLEDAETEDIEVPTSSESQSETVETKKTPTEEEAETEGAELMTSSASQSETEKTNTDEAEIEGVKLQTISASQSETVETEETHTEDNEAKGHEAEAEIVELESQSTLQQSSAESLLEQSSEFRGLHTSSAIAARRKRLRDMSKEELETAAGNQATFSGVTKAFMQLLSGSYCTKDVWHRPRRDRECKSGWKRGSGFQVGLCLPHCTGKKKHRVGEHCCEKCHARRRQGNTDLLTCSRFPWQGGSYDRKCAHRRSCGITSGTCTFCRSGYVAHAGRCYKTKAGYACVGETCYRKCTEPAPDDCSGGEHGHCGADTQACVKGGIELAAGVMDAAVSTGLLVATCGGSAAITAGNAASKKLAAKTFTKQQAKRLNTQNALQVARSSFMKKVTQAGKYWINDVLKANLKGKVEENMYNKIVRYSEANQDALQEEMKKKIKARENEVSIVLKEIDIVGLGDAIDSSTGDSVDAPNVQAGKWLNVLSVGDPTGIVGAVAGFLKNPYCEDLERDSIAKIKEEIKENSPDGEMDLIAEELALRAPYVAPQPGLGNGCGKGGCRRRPARGTGSGKR